MIDAKYLPNLKTSDSELRALRYLDAETRNAILPVFELTRSRVTSKLPHGSVHRRAEQVKELYGSYPFILDLTTEADLSNPEIDAFFDEAGGYGNWCNFVELVFPPNIIPCLQYVEDGNEANFKSQVQRLLAFFPKVALRTSATEPETKKLYDWAVEASSTDSIFLIGSLFFLEQNAGDVYFDRCRNFIQSVVGNSIPLRLAFPGSSFPRNVGTVGCGPSESGKFTAVELALFDRVRNAYPNLPIVYSDYASVHPVRYPTTGGGTWIPRVDIAQGDEFAFTRARQEAGGYSFAAREINKLYGARLPACWGTEQIRAAATGHPPGRSPSFWISARINIWITQRVRQFSTLRV